MRTPGRATLPDFWGPMVRTESDQKSDSPKGERGAPYVGATSPKGGLHNFVHRAEPNDHGGCALFPAPHSTNYHSLAPILGGVKKKASDPLTFQNQYPPCLGDLPEFDANFSVMSRKAWGPKSPSGLNVAIFWPQKCAKLPLSWSRRTRPDSREGFRFRDSGSGGCRCGKSLNPDRGSWKGPIAGMEAPGRKDIGGQE